MAGLLSTMNSNNYDAKKFRVCAPWDSKRGNSWTLVFKPAFEDGCRGQIDQWASWYDLLVTEADFGGANGPVHPGGNLGISKAVPPDAHGSKHATAQFFCMHAN